MKKIILMFFVLIGSLSAEDKFLGIEMLSKAEKGKWICKEYHRKPFFSCEPKGNFTEATSVITDKNRKIVQVWKQGVKGYNTMPNYMEWSKNEYATLKSKHGEFHSEKSPWGGFFLTKRINNTLIKLVVDNRPNIHYTHDLYNKLEKKYKN